MNSEKYIGLDVHQATIVVAVMDSSGKLVMESILETKAATKEDATRWNNPNPNPRYDTRPASSNGERGWMARIIPAPPAEGKNVLDIPFYRSGHFGNVLKLRPHIWDTTAISLIDRAFVCVRVSCAIVVD